MALDRRSVLTAGLGAGLGAGLAATTANAGPRGEGEVARRASAALPSAAELGLEPGADHDQSGVLQAAIDEAANRGAPLQLPPGRFRVAAVQLRPGVRIVGAAGMTTLEFTGGSSFSQRRGRGRRGP